MPYKRATWAIAAPSMLSTAPPVRAAKARAEASSPVQVFTVTNGTPAIPLGRKGTASVLKTGSGPPITGNPSVAMSRNPSAEAAPRSP